MDGVSPSRNGSLPGVRSWPEAVVELVEPRVEGGVAPAADGHFNVLRRHQGIPCMPTVIQLSVGLLAGPGRPRIESH